MFLRHFKFLNYLILHPLPAADLIAYMSAGRKLDKLANNVIQDVKKPWLVLACRDVGQS